jgi:DNA-binding GntR family transcriptional regulator
MTALDPRSLTERTYLRLRNEILSSRLKPGQKLRLRDLCDLTGASLSVVREATTRLAAEGLLSAEAQRGYSVPSVDRKDLLDLTHARIEIECLCLLRAIDRGGVEWEADLVAAFHRLRRTPLEAVDADAKEEWARAHAVFHDCLVAGCDNRWLLRMRQMLFAQSERYRRLSVALQADRRDLDAEHRGLMEAVLAHDETAATERLRAHLMLTTDILLKSELIS